MKLIYNAREDFTELKSLIMDWLHAQRGQIVDGIKCRHLFNDIYGIDIDHHVYTDVLEYLVGIGEATHQDGKYFLKVRQ